MLKRLMEKVKEKSSEWWIKELDAIIKMTEELFTKYLPSKRGIYNKVRNGVKSKVKAIKWTTEERWSGKVVKINGNGVNYSGGKSVRLEIGWKKLQPVLRL